MDSGTDFYPSNLTQEAKDRLDPEAATALPHQFCTFLNTLTIVLPPPAEGPDLVFNVYHYLEVVSTECPFTTQPQNGKRCIIYDQLVAMHKKGRLPGP